MLAITKILLLLLTLNCAVIVTDIPSQSVAYDPPDHKHVLLMTRYNMYSSPIKGDLTNWTRIHLSYPDNYYNDKPVSAFGPNYNSYGSVNRIEIFTDITYCRGTWVAVAKINSLQELGGDKVQKGAVYWIDRQDPINTTWNRYEIDLKGPYPTPVSLSCNEFTGVFTLASFHYILSSSNPKASDSWTIEEVSKKFNVSSEHFARKTFNFKESTYVLLTDFFDNIGYLALKYSDKPWVLKHIQKDLGAPAGALLHSMLFDPLTNKIIFSTDTKFLLSCEVGTLSCDVISTPTGVDSMATDHNGEFYGTSYTNSWLWKTSATEGKFITNRGKGYSLYSPKNLWSLSDTHIITMAYLKDRWFAAGNLGQLFYTEPKAKFYEKHSNKANCGKQAGKLNDAVIINRNLCVWKEVDHLGDGSSASANNPLKVSKKFGRGRIIKLLTGGL